MKKVKHKIALVLASIDGALDGLQLDEKDELVEKSIAINQFKATRFYVIELEKEINQLKLKS